MPTTASYMTGGLLIIGAVIFSLLPLIISIIRNGR